MSTSLGILPVAWLRRPLCRRYSVVMFSLMPKVRLKHTGEEALATCWALGTLINGDREILGAWNSNDEGAIPAEVFGGLYDRGVEYITYASGDMAASHAAFKAAYPRAVLLPSVEQSLGASLASVAAAHRPAMSDWLRAAAADPAEPPTFVVSGSSSAQWRERYPGILKQWDEAVAAFHPLFALPEPYRQLVRSVDRTAMEVQERLMRAIHRHGPFIDASDAFEFVAAALQRADQQLWREREATRLSRDVHAPRSDRFARASGGAVGTPTLA